VAISNPEPPIQPSAAAENDSNPAIVPRHPSIKLIEDPNASSIDAVILQVPSLIVGRPVMNRAASRGVSRQVVVVPALVTLVDAECSESLALSGIAAIAPAYPVASVATVAIVVMSAEAILE